MLLVILGAAGGCGDDWGGTTSTGPPEAPLVPTRHPIFAVRGRLPDQPELRLFVHGEDGPVPAAVLRTAVDSARSEWNAAGSVRLRMADAVTDLQRPGSVDVIIAWRRGTHDTCQPFGQDTSVAHAGPMEMPDGIPTFVHLDASRDWDSESRGGPPLRAVLLHELGHVLGLQHVPDPGSVVYPEYDRRRRTPGLSDRAGLATLYGGMDDGPGDLFVNTRSGQQATPPPPLRRIAPPGASGFALFDTDDDGSQELLVWRTGEESNGSLMIYHFGNGARLERTVGPILGVVIPGTPTRFLIAEDGTGALVSIPPSGRYYARIFDGAPVPTPLIANASFRLRGSSGADFDADSDGLVDTAARDWPTQANGAELLGDIDGDGTIERVSRIRIE